MNFITQQKSNKISARKL